MEKSAVAGWYIVKRASEQCEIVDEKGLEDLAEEPLERWGPFESKGAAIAKRVGLIRAGKCQPV